MRRTAFLAFLVVLSAFLTMTLPGCGMLRRRAANRPPFAKVSAPVAYEILRDSPEILVIDLRTPQEFNGDTGHIFRAHNIPLERLPFRLLEISAFRDDTFLVYCDTPACAEEGMAVLSSSGFEDAVLVDGGIDAWIKRGFRTVLPGDAVGRAAEREANAHGGGTQPPPGTPAATAIESPPAPPPPR